MYLEKLRSQNPLTICITNDVVKILQLMAYLLSVPHLQ